MEPYASSHGDVRQTRVWPRQWPAANLNTEMAGLSFRDHEISTILVLGCIRSVLAESCSFDSCVLEGRGPHVWPLLFCVKFLLVK